MFDKSAIGIFIAETPVHCGVGQDVGIVDQPIQRERHTNYPRIQGSEIKGVFRQYYEKQHAKGNNAEEIFGPEGSGAEGGDYASAVSFGDARLLFFPVKSLKRTYVWITSEDVLDKFSRTLQMTKVNNIHIQDIPSVDDNNIICDSSIALGNKIILDEYMFNIVEQTKVEQASCLFNNNFNNLLDKIIPNIPEYNYLKNSLKERLCIVSNDIFRDFTEMSTEVITRIKIDDETGVVKSGALWTEEYLPADTILYFPVFAGNTRNKGEQLPAETVMERIKSLNPYIQIGGNETIGKGFVRINWVEKSKSKEVNKNGN